MKLVMHYEEGDGCTYSCTHDLPFEYDSPEQALVDFEALIKANREAGWRAGSFKFAGMEFYSNTFVYEGVVYLPDFYTLDEWFETHKAQ